MPRIRKLLPTCCFAALLSFCFMQGAWCDEEAQAGRQIINKWQDAVVTVRLVTKTSMAFGGEESSKRESKTEATGAVIDPSGLTVMSLSATSPEEILQNMMPQDGGGFKVSSEITDVKLILSDGRELPAKIVLRDRDLDLAFIRPTEKPSEPLAAVDLTKATKPELLDQVITLHRLGTVASRAVAACVDRIQSIVKKPRTFYVPGTGAMGATLGAPVFAMDTSPVGLLLLRTLPSGLSSNVSWLSSTSSMGMMYIVLPAEDVLEVAKQAPKVAEA